MPITPCPSPEDIRCEEPECSGAWGEWAEEAYEIVCPSCGRVLWLDPYIEP